MNVTFKVNETCNNFAIPTAIYSLMNPIRKKKSRFNTLVSSISPDAVLEKPERLP